MLYIIYFIFEIYLLFSIFCFGYAYCKISKKENSDLKNICKSFLIGFQIPFVLPSYIFKERCDICELYINNRCTKSGRFCKKYFKCINFKRKKIFK